MQARFLYGEQNHVNYTNTGAALAAGDVVPLTSFCGITTQPIAATTGAGALATGGVFDVAVIAGSGSGSGGDIDIGEKVYWDDTNNAATTSSGGNVHLGIALETVSDTATTVKVLVIPGM